MSTNSYSSNFNEAFSRTLQLMDSTQSVISEKSRQVFAILDNSRGIKLRLSAIDKIMGGNEWVENRDFAEHYGTMSKKIAYKIAMDLEANGANITDDILKKEVTKHIDMLETFIQESNLTATHLDESILLANAEGVSVTNEQQIQIDELVSTTVDTFQDNRRVAALGLPGKNPFETLHKLRAATLIASKEKITLPNTQKILNLHGEIMRPFMEVGEAMEKVRSAERNLVRTNIDKLVLDQKQRNELGKILKNLIYTDTKYDNKDYESVLTLYIEQHKNAPDTPETLLIKLRSISGYKNKIKPLTEEEFSNRFLAYTSYHILYERSIDYENKRQKLLGAGRARAEKDINFWRSAQRDTAVQFAKIINSSEETELAIYLDKLNTEIAKIPKANNTNDDDGINMLIEQIPVAQWKTYDTVRTAINNALSTLQNMFGGNVQQLKDTLSNIDATDFQPTTKDDKQEAEKILSNYIQRNNGALYLDGKAADVRVNHEALKAQREVNLLGQACLILAPKNFSGITGVDLASPRTIVENLQKDLLKDKKYRKQLHAQWKELKNNFGTDKSAEIQTATGLDKEEFIELAENYLFKRRPIRQKYFPTLSLLGKDPMLASDGIIEETDDEQIFTALSHILKKDEKTYGTLSAKEAADTSLWIMSQATIANELYHMEGNRLEQADRSARPKGWNQWRNWVLRIHQLEKYVSESLSIPARKTTKLLNFIPKITTNIIKGTVGNLWKWTTGTYNAVRKWEGKDMWIPGLILSPLYPVGKLVEMIGEAPSYLLNKGDKLAQDLSEKEIDSIVDAILRKVPSAISTTLGGVAWLTAHHLRVKFWNSKFDDCDIDEKRKVLDEFMSLIMEKKKRENLANALQHGEATSFSKQSLLEEVQALLDENIDHLGEKYTIVSENMDKYLEDNVSNIDNLMESYPEEIRTNAKDMLTTFKTQITDFTSVLTGGPNPDEQTQYHRLTEIVTGLQKLMQKKWSTLLANFEGIVTRAIQTEGQYLQAEISFRVASMRRPATASIGDDKAQQERLDHESKSRQAIQQTIKNTKAILINFKVHMEYVDTLVNTTLEHVGNLTKDGVNILDRTKLLNKSAKDLISASSGSLLQPMIDISDVENIESKYEMLSSNDIQTKISEHLEKHPIIDNSSGDTQVLVGADTAK